MKKLKATCARFLKSGLSPQRASWALTLGLALGVFPIYGIVSAMTVALALLLRLNTAIMLAAVYSMTLLKPILIIPFLRIGEFAFRAEPMPISLVELSKRFSDTPLDTLKEFGWSFAHATTGWILVLPLIALVIYPLGLRSMRRIAAEVQKRRDGESDDSSVSNQSGEDVRHDGPSPGVEGGSRNPTIEH